LPPRKNGPRPWTAAEIQTAEAMRGKHTVREISETLGRPQSSVSNLLHRPGRMEAARLRLTDAPSVSHKAGDGDRAEVTGPVSERITTLEQLIAIARVDLTVWDVERAVVNKWEVGSKHPETGDVIIAPLIQVKAWLKRKHPLALTLAELRTAIVADIRNEVKRGKPATVARRYVDSGWLFQFPPFDLHMGKYTWGEESVTDYDVDIAEDLFNASLDFLRDRALKLCDGKIARVLCVFGNDVSHIDSKSGETTAGTRMDVDTRYIRVYRRICAIHRRAIDVLRQVAPVDVKIVPGNHDELTSFHLGEILATRYENVKHVTVDNSPRKRKYYDYGVNLFGFTHGEAERVPELPLLMAREVPDLWAKCPSREEVLMARAGSVFR
jgi:hypothetical protein